VLFDDAAFAELQTDMTEIVGNISGPAGLPFHSYTGFCVRTFFPGVPANNHLVLSTFEVSCVQADDLQEKSHTMPIRRRISKNSKLFIFRLYDSDCKVFSIALIVSLPCEDLRLKSRLVLICLSEFVYFCFSRVFSFR